MNTHSNSDFEARVRADMAADGKKRDDQARIVASALGIPFVNRVNPADSFAMFGPDLTGRQVRTTFSGLAGLKHAFADYWIIVNQQGEFGRYRAIDLLGFIVTEG